MRFQLFQKNTKKSNSRSKSKNEQESLHEEIVPLAMKMKVVAALAVVGFAGYIAYWVQEPTALKTDVLNTPSEQSQVQAQTSSQTGTQVDVSMADLKFDPASLQVKKGTTVVWTNKDTVPHNIVGNNFSSGPLNPGQSFSYTFSEDGNYDYYCSLHPEMKASVVVGEAPQVAESVQGSTESGTSQEIQTLGSTPASSSVGEIPPLTSATPEDGGLVASTSQDPTQVMQTTAAETTSASQESTVTPATVDDQHGAAPEQPLSESAKQVVTATKLTDSGPEDFLYVGIFALVLYFNRKRLLKWKEVD
jgi:plastocyanin